MQLSVNRAPNGRNAAAGAPTLAQLKEGESGILDRLDVPEDVARRLMELGFLPGHTIVPARSAPGGEPRVYRVDGSEVALRRETAARLILRAAIEKALHGYPSHERLPQLRRLCGSHRAAPARPAVRPHVVAIIGPPNSGKSTLFNRLTGLRQKVANFPGVTVEQRIGRAKMKNHREVILVDLPGVYSLNPRSEDEQVTRDVLTGEMQDVPKPDAVLLILDSTNLGRHLVLAAPILSLKLPTLVILNMADDLSSRGGQIDTGGTGRPVGSAGRA